jgi:hypothetical protein
MANARKYAGSPYIKLDHLRGKPPLRERIAFVAEETGNFGERLVVTFESGKRLSLNATSVGNLMSDINADYDNWSGHDVEIYAGEVGFQGTKKDAVLVRVVDLDTPPPPPEKPAKKAAARADFDDEIPPF